ncbi:hypothetical protein ACQ2H7_001912 [Candidozyma auris]
MRRRRNRAHVMTNQPYYKENYAPQSGYVPPPPPPQPQQTGYGGGYQQGYQAGYGSGTGGNQGNSGFNNDYNQNYGVGSSSYGNEGYSGSAAPPDYAPPSEPPKGYTK